jgi:hypothetical protein
MMDVDIFYRAYRSAYPMDGLDIDGSYNFSEEYSEEHELKLIYLLTETALADRLRKIESILEKIHANDRTWVDVLRHRDPDIFDDIKPLWLFAYGVPRDFFPNLQRMIITHNNTEYSEGDWALFMYMKNQDLQTLETLKGIPLSMIRDMYQPMIDEQFNEWYKQTHS